jgi:hypothetical protein
MRITTPTSTGRKRLITRWLDSLERPKVLYLSSLIIGILVAEGINTPLDLMTRPPLFASGIGGFIIGVACAKATLNILKSITKDRQEHQQEQRRQERVHGKLQPVYHVDKWHLWDEYQRKSEEMARNRREWSERVVRLDEEQLL